MCKSGVDRFGEGARGVACRALGVGAIMGSPPEGTGDRGGFY